MKKRTHKYFVNQRHKQRLESKAHNCRTYWSHTFFVTKEPDPRDLRECTNSILWYAGLKNISIEESIAHFVERDCRHATGRFIYYDRPEVPYSIHKVHTDPKYSKRRKYLCNQANRKIRREAKRTTDLYQYGQYKKIYDVAWELD